MDSPTLLLLLLSLQYTLAAWSTTGIVTSSLDGNDWRLSSVDDGGIVNLKNATVPGGIWDNLHRSGLVGSPLYRGNDLVYANITSQSWLFEKSFQVSPSALKSSTFVLEFEGVQTNATVAINGRTVGTTNNMFKLFRFHIPMELLLASSNILSVRLHPTIKVCPPGHEVPPGFCNEPGFRDESDAWGWDWSPSLNPMAIYKSVQLISIPPFASYVSMVSPQVMAIETDERTGAPLKFMVNTTLEIVTVCRYTEVSHGVLKVVGDWGTSNTSTVTMANDICGTNQNMQTLQTVHRHILLYADVSKVKLWWPRHYGTANLHSVTVSVDWVSKDGLSSGLSSITTKQFGFRQVTLYTGPSAPQQPAQVDPKHKNAFIGCFNDGNPWWGGPQHALPYLAASSSNMTVTDCLMLCHKAGQNFTLAGIQKGSSCYCGNTIGEVCDGCLALTGTKADPSQCGWPCTGNPQIACGGASYMWNANSVYNITMAFADGPVLPPNKGSIPSPPPPSSEGSGNSAFVLKVNGVKVFARGGNLVPFELLEATVSDVYIKKIVQSVHDGNMNMIRVWGGGIYQSESFYESCDQLGVMLYHDMMFSFRAYPHSDAFFANVKEEIEYQVLRLRSHPSIALWDSSNENEGDPDFFYRVVLDTIAQTDPSRPLWPASPSSGFSEGVNTSTGLPNGKPLVGRYQPTLDTHMPYNFCDAKFVTSTSRNHSFNPSHPDNPTETFFKSEFGQVSLPAFETLAAALNGTAGDYGIYSDIMVHRKHAGATLEGPIVSLFGNKSSISVTNFSDVDEKNFRRVIYLSQMSQTFCIKTIIEELRRGENTFGSIIWQLNDVWQASSWGSLDYGGRWRALHHSLQAEFAASIVSIWKDSTNVYIEGSHHGSPPSSALQVEVDLVDISTGQYIQKHIIIWKPLSSASTDQLLVLPLSNIDDNRQVIRTQIFETNSADPVPIDESETVHPLQSPVNIEWEIVPKRDILVKAVEVLGSNATVSVENNGNAPIFYAVVSSTLSGRFSRNLLFISPSKVATITFFFEQKQDVLTVDDFQAGLTIDWLNRAAHL